MLPLTAPVALILLLVGAFCDEAFAQARGAAPPAVQPSAQLVVRFDRDGDGRLNLAERRAAREALSAGNTVRRAPAASVAPGRRLAPADVSGYPNSIPIYDQGTIRTFFLQFEESDWEQELTSFFNTDVDVPAVMTVDGRTYRDVGVHFRGSSSFRQVPLGYKHSLNLTIDWVHDRQNVGGYNSFNLLNSNNDPTFLRTMLYGEIARDYIPIAKTNYVRVVINGENWGIYVSSQQVDKDFIEEHFGTRGGARWRAPGAPQTASGLQFFGEDVSRYRVLYDLKSEDNPKAWTDLIALMRTLNDTPIDQLEAVLAPVLDVDGVLKFLALDVALVNSDGYWTRASDYNIYQSPSGKFYILPHDFNEAMGNEGGPRVSGPGAASPVLDALVASSDAGKPLRSKLLAVPALRARYLAYVRDIAERWLDWQTLGPIAQRYQSLIRADVRLDTRKLYSVEQFDAGLTAIKDFVDRRRSYLLESTAR